MRSVRAMFLKFRGTNYKGWLDGYGLGMCGAVVVGFVLFCELTYVLLIIWSCILLFERLKIFYFWM